MQYSIDIRYGKFLKTPKGGQTQKSGQALKSSQTVLSFNEVSKPLGETAQVERRGQLMKHR